LVLFISISFLHIFLESFHIYLLKNGVRCFDAFSYAPKNTNPPILIHVTLGTTPLNNTAIPPSLYRADKILGIEGVVSVCAADVDVDVDVDVAVAREDDMICDDDNINLVFTTSNGVVHAAAIPPDTLPTHAHSKEDKGRGEEEEEDEDEDDVF
jgi:hypothetical protein